MASNGGSDGGGLLFPLFLEEEGKFLFCFVLWQEVEGSVLLAAVFVRNSDDLLLRASGREGWEVFKTSVGFA